MLFRSIAVFGRIGSRPFSASEMRKFYLTPEGKPWSVTDEIERARFIAPPKPRQLNPSAKTVAQLDATKEAMSEVKK